MAILTLKDIRLSFGTPPLIDGVQLQVEEGDRLCLMGRNGSGKTTLMRVIRGDVLPDGGEVYRAQGLSVAFLPQETPPGVGGSVFEVVAAGLGDARRLSAEYHEAGVRVAEGAGAAGLRKLETLQARMDETGGWTVHQVVESVMGKLSLDPAAEFSTLSGGQQRRAMLARALVSCPDLLLLDEPTNHLDIDTILWLEEFLLRGVRSLLFVTHDRAFARRLATRTAELDRGRLLSFGCGYDEFVARREAQMEAEQARLAQFERKLAEEEAWIRRGVKARRTRDEGRVKALERMREERRGRRGQPGSVNMRLQDAERSGFSVVEAEGACFGYGGNPVIQDLNTTVVRGDRVGIIGPNGSGKTTLLRLLLGEIAPQRGTVRLGVKREIAYFDQLREQLDPDRTVADSLGEGRDTVVVNGVPRHVVGYLKDFLFAPDRAVSPVRVLSGGERNRLLLARLFARPSNILVMDEPTNDLDMDTLDLLEDLLSDYRGTLLLVSHDREFLNRLVTSTMVLAGDGRVREYAGGYDDWVRQSAGEVEASEEAGRRKAPAPDGGAKEDAGARPRRLTFREERELEEWPGRIASLEEERLAVHETLADPSFYRTAGVRVASLNARLAELETLIEEAYGRWGELESLRQ